MESISRSPVPSKGLGFFNALPYPVVTQLVTLFTGPLNALLSVLPVHKELDRAAHRGLQRPLKAHTFRTGEAKWEGGHRSSINKKYKPAQPPINPPRPARQRPVRAPVGVAGTQEKQKTVMPRALSHIHRALDWKLWTQGALVNTSARSEG